MVFYAENEVLWSFLCTKNGKGKGKAEPEQSRAGNKKQKKHRISKEGNGGEVVWKELERLDNILCILKMNPNLFIKINKSIISSYVVARVEWLS